MIHESIFSQAVIVVDRLMLRPIRKSDKGLIELYASDPRVANMTTTIPHPLPPGMIDDVIARARRDDRIEDVWAMDASMVGGGEVMGLISLKRLDDRQSEIGYLVAPAFWNTGLASDAVKALVDDNPLDNETIFASVFQDNPASAKVLTHCGFEYIGDAESFSLARDANVPTWTYLKKLA